MVDLNIAFSAIESETFSFLQSAMLNSVTVLTSGLALEDENEYDAPEDTYVQPLGLSLVL